MKWDEEIHCRFSVQVSYLSAGEVGTSEAIKVIATITYSRVGVRHDCYEFCRLLPRTTSGFDTIRMIIDRLTSIVLSKVLDIV